MPSAELGNNGQRKLVGKWVWCPGQGSPKRSSSVQDFSKLVKLVKIFPDGSMRCFFTFPAQAFCSGWFLQWADLLWISEIAMFRRWPVSLFVAIVCCFDCLAAGVRLPSIKADTTCTVPENEFLGWFDNSFGFDLFGFLWWFCFFWHGFVGFWILLQKLMKSSWLTSKIMWMPEIVFDRDSHSFLYLIDIHSVWHQVVARWTSHWSLGFLRQRDCAPTAPDISTCWCF